MPARCSVSVIVPNRNSGRFLRTCIESILRQTVCGLEVVVVDGASDDDSLDIVQALAARDNRITFISERDHGQADAINKGLARASGEFVTWLNADDRLVPEALEFGVQALRADPSLVLVYGSVVDIHEDGRFLNLGRGHPLGAEELEYEDFIPQAGALIRRFEGLRVDDTLTWGFDWELWIRLARRGKIKCLNHIMGYCITQGNYTRKSNQLTLERTAELLRITRRHARHFDRRLLFAAALVVMGRAGWPVGLVWTGYYAWIRKAVVIAYRVTGGKAKGLMV